MSKNEIRRLLIKHFNFTELRDLSFELNIDHEALSVQNKNDLARELVAYCERFGMMSELLITCNRLRPDVPWPEEVVTDFQEASTAIADQSHRLLVNPFGKTGKIQDPANYLLRRPLTDQIINELGKSVSISLVGSSQTGKSSLLWHVYQNGTTLLPGTITDSVYLSLELIHSEDDLFDFICEELNVTPTRGYRLARSLRNRKVLLCLDEIEKMTWNGFSLNVRTELRGLADGSQAPFTLLIASRSSLGQLFPDSPEMTSPLAGLCAQINMPDFTLDELRLLTRQYLHGTGRVFPETDLQHIWQQSHGHPGRTQQLLKEAYVNMFG